MINLEDVCWNHNKNYNINYKLNDNIINLNNHI